MSKKKKGKKGNQQLMGLAVGVIVVVVIVLVLAIGVKITSDIQKTFCDNTNADLACSGNATGLSSTQDSAYSAAANGTLGLIGISTWLPTVGTILIASVLVGLLMWGFFALFKKGKA